MPLNASDLQPAVLNTLEFAFNIGPGSPHELIKVQHGCAAGPGEASCIQSAYLDMLDSSLSGLSATGIGKGIFDTRLVKLEVAL